MFNMYFEKLGNVYNDSSNNDNDVNEAVPHKKSDENPQEKLELSYNYQNEPAIQNQNTSYGSNEYYNSNKNYNKIKGWSNDVETQKITGQFDNINNIHSNKMKYSDRENEFLNFYQGNNQNNNETPRFSNELYDSEGYYHYPRQNMANEISDIRDKKDFNNYNDFETFSGRNNPDLINNNDYRMMNSSCSNINESPNEKEMACNTLNTYGLVDGHGRQDPYNFGNISSNFFENESLNNKPRQYEYESDSFKCNGGYQHPDENWNHNISPFDQKNLKSGNKIHENYMKTEENKTLYNFEKKYTYLNNENDQNSFTKNFDDRNEGFYNETDNSALNINQFNGYHSNYGYDNCKNIFNMKNNTPPMINESNGNFGEVTSEIYNLDLKKSKMLLKPRKKDQLNLNNGSSSQNSNIPSKMKNNGFSVQISPENYNYDDPQYNNIQYSENKFHIYSNNSPNNINRSAEQFNSSEISPIINQTNEIKYNNTNNISLYNTYNDFNNNHYDVESPFSPMNYYNQNQIPEICNNGYSNIQNLEKPKYPTNPTPVVTKKTRKRRTKKQLEKQKGSQLTFESSFPTPNFNKDILNNFIITSNQFQGNQNLSLNQNFNENLFPDLSLGQNDYENLNHFNTDHSIFNDVHKNKEDTSEYEFLCFPCNKRFKRLSTLKIHIFAHLKDAYIFVCPKITCKSGHKSLSACLKHIEVSHMAEDRGLLNDTLKKNKYLSVFRSHTTLLDYYKIIEKEQFGINHLKSEVNQKNKIETGIVENNPYSDLNTKEEGDKNKKTLDNMYENPFIDAFCYGCFTYPKSLTDHPCTRMFFSLSSCPSCKKEVVYGELKNHVHSDDCNRSLPVIKTENEN